MSFLRRQCYFAFPPRLICAQKTPKTEQSTPTRASRHSRSQNSIKITTTNTTPKARTAPCFIIGLTSCSRKKKRKLSRFRTCAKRFIPFSLLRWLPFSLSGFFAEEKTIQKASGCRCFPLRHSRRRL